MILKLKIWWQEVSKKWLVALFVSFLIFTIYTFNPAAEYLVGILGFGLYVVGLFITLYVLLECFSQVAQPWIKRIPIKTYEDRMSILKRMLAASIGASTGTIFVVFYFKDDLSRHTLGTVVFIFICSIAMAFLSAIGIACMYIEKRISSRDINTEVTEEELQHKPLE